MKRVAYTCAASLALWVPAVSGADLTLSRSGRVSIELIRAETSARNTLWVSWPHQAPRAVIAATGCPAATQGALQGVPLVTGSEALEGCRVSLDADSAAAGVQPFPAGSTLKFKLCVQNDGDPDCEFRWSSNRGSNSDGDEHLRTTALHAGRFPGQILQLAWEDQPLGPNHSDRDFNDLVAVLRLDGDRDGDGLWDDWEELGIDTDGDLQLDHRLTDARPDQKDVFVEADWMACNLAGSDCAAGDQGHQPSPEALSRAVSAFAGAGVRLHVELSNAIPHRRLLDLGCFGGSSFAQVKNDPANFGPRNPRRFTHHYAIFGHKQSDRDRGSAGCSERPGNDLLVTIADWSRVQPNLVRLEAGAFLHELGHNFGLRHGGFEDVDGKPNYLSVMNGAYQFAGVPQAGVLDYSHQTLPAVDESRLFEAQGLTHASFYGCPDLRARPADPGAPTDWNCDDDVNDGGPLLLDVNRDRFCVRPLAGELLDSAPQGDDELLDVPVFDGQRFITETWISDGANRVCDTRRVGSDQILRQQGHVQPRLLRGASDWDRLDYVFQATRHLDRGSEVSDQEDIPVLPNIESFPDLAVTGFTTAPAGVVRPGATLTYTALVANKGYARAEPVVVEQTLPPGVRFESCTAAAPFVSCERTADGRVLARIPSLDITADDGPAAVLTVVTRVSRFLPDGRRLESTVSARIEGDDTCSLEPSCTGEDPEVEANQASVAVTVSKQPDCRPGASLTQGSRGCEH